MGHSNKKQVFYYDDFLGKNFLDQFLEKNEDERLISFIKKIKNSKNKVFILTTREHILNQARQKYETLRDKDLELSKCILDLESYTRLEKARILYNHLFFSPLSKAVKNSVCVQEKYLKIIEHRNYDPRIVKHITNLTHITNTEDFYKECIRQLNNPAVIWETAFDEQISESSKSILLVLYGLSGYCTSDELEQSWEKYYSFMAAKLGQTRKHDDFRRSIKELERSFIKLEPISSKIAFVKFYDPSVSDFLIEKIKLMPNIISEMIEHAFYWEQVIYFSNLDLSAVRIKQAEDFIDLPSCKSKNRAGKLLWFASLCEKNAFILEFLKEETKALVEAEEIDISLLQLLAEAPDLGLDYEQILEVLAAQIIDFDGLKRLINSISNFRLDSFYKRTGASRHYLENKADEISQDLLSGADSCLDTDENGYFIGDAQEIESYIVDINSVSDYFHLNISVEDLEKVIQNKVPSSDRFDDEQRYPTASFKSLETENNEINRIFGAGFIN